MTALVDFGMRSATEPAEVRGSGRDDVRMLVARRAGVAHAGFDDLVCFLEPGDLLVVNTSATLPAAVDWAHGTVHFSTALPDGTWAVELRSSTGGKRPAAATAGEVVELSGGRIRLLAPYPPQLDTGRLPRLWQARVEVSGPVERYLARHGRPIAYDYVPLRWPLAAYQTVFARQPGSAEMPSAGRPFTTGIVTDLVTAGIAVAPLTLHTGVSSLEKGEPPLPEPYRVPEATARLVNSTLRAGGRVVAVGTTVTRALETVAGEDGRVRAGSGWTELVLGPDHPAQVVRGLITGWHEPGASHLRLLEAVAGPEVVAVAYETAGRAGYLWHEFGDSALLLA